MNPIKLFKLFIVLFLFSTTVFAQQSKKPRPTQEQMISKKAAITEEQAKLVAVIQNNYKKNIKTLMSDSSLDANAKRKKIDQLIAEKNIKLTSVLNADELNRFLPATERLKTDPAFARKFTVQQERNRRPGKIAISKSPRTAIEALNLAYAQSVRTINSDKTLTQEAKKKSIERLIKEQKQKLTEHFKQTSDSANRKGANSKPAKSGNQY